MLLLKHTRETFKMVHGLDTNDLAHVIWKTTFGRRTVNKEARDRVGILAALNTRLAALLQSLHLLAVDQRLRLQRLTVGHGNLTS